MVEALLFRRVDDSEVVDALVRLSSRRWNLRFVVSMAYVILRRSWLTCLVVRMCLEEVMWIKTIDGIRTREASGWLLDRRAIGGVHYSTILYDTNMA